MCVYVFVSIADCQVCKLLVVLDYILYNWRFKYTAYRDGAGLSSHSYNMQATKEFFGALGSAIEKGLYGILSEYYMFESVVRT